MASVLGDLWRLTDFQTYLGEQVLNVYHYRVTSVTGINDDGYSDFVDWYQDNLLDVIRVLQVNLLNHNLLEVRNLSNGIDLFQKVIDIDGAYTPSTGQYAPSYVSWGYKLIRESLTTRHGYKRFAGVPDETYAGNTPGAISTETAAIEDALAMDWVDGMITLAEPIILRAPTGSPPYASYVYSSIGDAQFVGLGSQNTRKAGRGA